TSKRIVSVPDEQLDSAITASTAAAHPGEIGDGTLFVSPVEDAIRIRTGDRGESAL
ncbi:MAG: P-II family nitrogen regulator, partial [Cyanobacteriota bacterium]